MKIKLNDVIKREILFGDRINYFKLIKILIYNFEIRAVFYYRIASILYNKKHRFIAQIINNRVKRNFGVYISLNAKIDMGLKLPHPNGIIIGDGVKVSKNCTIYQQVTLGGKLRSNHPQEDYPKIGDDVTIYSGAKVLGKIVIQDRTVIGANSVVITNTELDSVYIGIPAKKLESRGKNER